MPLLTMRELDKEKFLRLNNKDIQNVFKINFFSIFQK